MKIEFMSLQKNKLSFDSFELLFSAIGIFCVTRLHVLPEIESSGEALVTPLAMMQPNGVHILLVTFQICFQLALKTATSNIAIIYSTVSLHLVRPQLRRTVLDVSLKV